MVFDGDWYDCAGKVHYWKYCLWPRPLNSWTWKCHHCHVAFFLGGHRTNSTRLRHMFGQSDVTQIWKQSSEIWETPLPITRMRVNQKCVRYMHCTSKIGGFLPLKHVTQNLLVMSTTSRLKEIIKYPTIIHPHRYATL